MSVVEVLPANVLSPPYTAVIECAPTERPEVLNVMNPEAFSVPVPKVAPPSLNVTVPVAVPVAGATGLTVAVNVTA